MNIAFITRRQQRKHLQACIQELRQPEPTPATPAALPPISPGSEWGTWGNARESSDTYSWSNRPRTW